MNPRRFCILLFIASSLAHAQPTLNYSAPAAASSKSSEVTVYGTGLNRPLSLLSIPAADAIFTASSGESAVCRIVFPENTSDGLASIRVATRSGISSPMLICIDGLPTITPNGKNKKPRQAQAIELPIAIEGVAEELGSHYYTFFGHKGETISVDAVANRIGSKMDPLLRLLDADGKELVYCDDDPAIAPDARFSHTCTFDGTYIVEIRDAGYESSSQHRYRLRIGEEEIAITPTEEILRSSKTIPRTNEAEPNDIIAAATKFSLPTELKGRFDKPHDRDIYRFEAKKGDHVLVRSKTRSIGSPCDLFLRVAKADGSKLNDSKSDVPDEASVDASISEDGSYYLIVEELAGQEGFEYRIDVEPFAGFSLSTEVEKLDIPAGGQGEIKITALRREFKGPIAFTTDSPWLKLANEVMKEGQNDLQLKFRVAGDAPVGKAMGFRLFGKATINGVEYSQQVRTMPAIKKLFPLMRYPPPELDGEFGLGVKPVSTTTTAPTTAPTRPRRAK